MKALLRYALVKSWREQLLPALLLTPAVAFTAPLLVMLIFEAARGRAVYPVIFNAGLGGAGSAQMMGQVIFCLAALAAAIAAFSVFRAEIMARGIGAFYLAASPHAAAGATTVYGALVGAGSVLIGATVVVGFTWHLPSGNLGAYLFSAAVCAIGASTLGTLAVMISTDYGMLVPVGAIVVPGAISILETPRPALVAAVIGGVAVMLAVTQLVWRTRCAV